MPDYRNPAGRVTGQPPSPRNAMQQPRPAMQPGMQPMTRDVSQQAMRGTQDPRMQQAQMEQQLYEAQRACMAGDPAACRAVSELSAAMQQMRGQMSPSSGGPVMQQSQQNPMLAQSLSMMRRS